MCHKLGKILSRYISFIRLEKKIVFQIQNNRNLSNSKLNNYKVCQRIWNIYSSGRKGTTDVIDNNPHHNNSNNNTHICRNDSNNDKQNINHNKTTTKKNISPCDFVTLFGLRYNRSQLFIKHKFPFRLDI